MVLVEELEQLLLARKEDSLECRVRQDPLGELPHARVRPAVVQDKDCKMTGQPVGPNGVKAGDALAPTIPGKWFLRRSRKKGSNSTSCETPVASAQSFRHMRANAPSWTCPHRPGRRSRPSAAWGPGPRPPSGSSRTSTSSRPPTPASQTPSAHRGARLPSAGHTSG